MAKSAKTHSRANTTRVYKGTTSRQRERLKGGVLLLLIPAAILVAALARGVDEHRGEVPDWRPAPDTAAAAH